MVRTGSEGTEADHITEPQMETAAVASSGSLQQFLHLVTCRRRRTAEELSLSRLQRYEQLLALGRAVPSQRRALYEKLVFWSTGKTKSGAKILVLAPRGPKAETEIYIDMRELFAFAVSIMHDPIVTEGCNFAVIWVQLSDHRAAPWTLWRLRSSLHDRYSSQLEAVHVVHPSWSVRILRLVLWPLASDDFWDYFHCHERIEFLDYFVDLKKFRLPKDIYEYDKFLDKQAQDLHEQSKKSLRGYGGGLGGFSSSVDASEDVDRQQADAQMEELRRLLQQKGYDGRKVD